MSEQLIDLLKLGLLALLYLFFLRVIWAVWTELRTPATEPAVPTSERTTPKRPRASRPGRRAVSTLKVIEPAELAGGTYPLDAEMTMGRAPGCTVVVDDTYVSQVHARIFSEGDTWHVEDLGSTNGTFHNGNPVSGPRPLQSGDRVQLGNLVLELS